MNLHLYSKDTHSIRNWKEDIERTEPKANSEITVRQATPEELEKFAKFVKETKKLHTIR
jgi:hypothetical protein